MQRMIGRLQRRSRDRHLQEPKVVDEPPEEALNAARRVHTSDFGLRALRLQEWIRGKVVSTTEAGHSGYLLRFTDGSFVVCYLATGCMDYALGEGEPSISALRLMHSPDAGDGRPRLPSDVLYGNEECDLPVEVAKCRGQKVEGLAIGENSFNVCLPKGKELDARIVPDGQGRPALRVFWEQW